MLRPVAFSIIDSIVEAWERHNIPCLIQFVLIPAGDFTSLIVELSATEDDEPIRVVIGDSFGPADLATLEDVAGRIVEEAWDRPAVPAGWTVDTAGMGRDS